MRILLVDDSKTIRRVQKGILEQLGYSDIHEASDGQAIAAQVAQSTMGILGNAFEKMALAGGTA